MKSLRLPESHPFQSFQEPTLWNSFTYLYQERLLFSCNISVSRHVGDTGLLLLLANAALQERTSSTPQVMSSTQTDTLVILPYKDSLQVCGQEADLMLVPCLFPAHPFLRTRMSNLIGPFQAPPHRNVAYIAQMTHLSLWPILSGTLTIRKVKTVYVRLMPPMLCLSIVTPSIKASFEEILVKGVWPCQRLLIQQRCVRWARNLVLIVQILSFHPYSQQSYSAVS